MTKLKLSLIEDDTPVKLTLELPAHVHRDLVAYGQAMATGTGGKVVDPARLIEAVRLSVIRQQGANRLNIDKLPAAIDEMMPQQALVSALRKYNK